MGFRHVQAFSLLLGFRFVGLEVRDPASGWEILA